MTVEESEKMFPGTGYRDAANARQQAARVPSILLINYTWENQ